VRWEVPVITNRPYLADAVVIDIEAHPWVRRAVANPVIGTVLMEFDAARSYDEAEDALHAAVTRQVAAASSAPKVVRQTVVENEDSESGASPLARLLRSTGRHRSLRNRAMVASVADGLAEGIPPLLVATTIDTVTRGSASLLGGFGLRTAASRVFAIGGLGVAFWGLAAIIEYFKERTSSELANAVRRDLRVELYEHIQTLDVSTLESRDVSDWMAILEQDVNQVHQFIRQGTDPIVGIAANFVVAGATFMVGSPMLGLAQLLVIPPLVLASMALLKPIRERMLATRDDLERLNAVLTGNVRGMTTIASFNSQEKEYARVAAAADRHAASAEEAFAIEAVYVPTLRSIVGAGFVTTLVWGGGQVTRGTLAAGTLDMMAYSQLRLMAALARVGVSLDNYQKTSASLERIYSTLDARPTIVGGTRRLPARARGGEVTFDQVQFGYDSDRPVLKGLSLTFAAGSTTGIVGATGAGKSTILNLIVRFYDAQHGRVSLDGVDLRELRLDDLREAVAMVSQQVTLFAGTVRDNIAYARPDAPIDDVIEAARIAEAHDFIDALPDKYETRIGFAGLALSGGQRQRIAIARAVLANRPILLFDEATSALDHATEAALQRSLEIVTANRTTVIVAHRLSTIRHADLIYVIDDGRVCESGQHDTLIKAGGLYASMWGVQTGTLHRPKRPAAPRTTRRPARKRPAAGRAGKE
jgi:ATP-binding cassette, subfamily B, bacterial